MSPPLDSPRGTWSCATLLHDDRKCCWQRTLIWRSGFASIASNDERTVDGEAADVVKSSDQLKLVVALSSGATCLSISTRELRTARPPYRWKASEHVQVGFRITDA